MKPTNASWAETLTITGHLQQLFRPYSYWISTAEHDVAEKFPRAALGAQQREWTRLPPIHPRPVREDPAPRVLATENTWAQVY